MNNRKILVIVALAGIALLLLILFVFRDTRQRLYVSEPVTTNLRFARQIDDSTIHYFSGSAFASYDLESHKTAPLTPFYSLPSVVTEVLWSKQGALLQATGYSPVDQLYPELVKNGLSPNGYYWWLVDFKTGAIQLVGNPVDGADVRGAAWLDDTTFVYAEKSRADNTLQIIKNNLGQGSSAAIATLSDEALFVGATDDSVLYTEPSAGNYRLVVLNLATKQKKEVARDIFVVLATNTNGSAMLLQKGDYPLDLERPAGRLTLYDHTTSKTTTISSDFSGSASWRADRDTWVAIGSDQRNRPVGFSNQAIEHNTTFTLTGTDNGDETPEYQAIGQSAQGILLTDGSNQLRFASSAKLTSLPKLPNYATLRKGVYEPNFTIVYVENNQQYSVYITKNPYEENRQKAVQYLQEKGFDPYKLNLKWYAYDGVDTGFYLPPGVQPIEEPIPIDAEDIEAGE